MYHYNGSHTDVSLGISTGLQLLLMTIIIFGNGLVLIAVFKYIRKATPPCILIVNLAVADLIMGFILPLQAIARLHPTFAKSEISCFLRFSSMVFSSFSSMFAVLLMALDRYLGVCRCSAYQQITNSVRKTVISVCIMWVYSISLAAYPLRFFTESLPYPLHECIIKHVISMSYLILIPIQYFIVLALIAGIYISICRVALSKRRIISIDLGFVLTTRVMRLQRELRAAKLMAAILIIFILCWTPFACVMLYDITMETSEETITRLMDASVFLGIINSAVNPFVYPLQNRDFKKAFRQIMSCLYCMK